MQNFPWLVGNEISLADVAMAPYANRLDMLSMSEMWTLSRQRLTDRFARIKARLTLFDALTRWLNLIYRRQATTHFFERNFNMLELYHHGSSVCAAKVRFAISEKGLEWKSHYLDILKGEHFNPEYLKLNPKAVVPTLVHDGNVLVESTVICEYLDDEFPQVPLKPARSLDRAAMRLWTKIVDEELQPACKYITYAACHRHIIRRMPADKFNEYMTGPLESPETRVTGDPNWAQSKRDIVNVGIHAPGVAAKFRIYDRTLAKMEETLQDSAWLAGDSFSLADISLTPYVNRLDMLGMSELWTKSRPRLTDWFERIKARPVFKPCFLDYCPPDLTHDLKTYGSQSWPEVREMLAA